MIDPKVVKSIFLAATEKPRDERAAYLVEATVGNAALRARVEALLKADENSDSFLEAPAAAFGATLDLSPVEPPIIEEAGTLIGPYKLLEQIGEGGMGVVYMAEQQAPVRRRVALKIIKAGMDTRQVIARFEAERQALALMDHANIARVLDAGATESGRPYFVMELVRGLPITEYCDQNTLSVHERLELFVQVCHAVQHAHQKGIIHRDLKPTNVLVTLQDGRAVPKVIDFGVAKATNQQLTEKTLFTAFAQMVGTPTYMSPEQAEMITADIDTRSDIYTLGVLLYELLTGTTPFDQQRLREASFDEIRRIIRDEEPQHPSTRISTLGETRTNTASRRQVAPDRLSQLVQGDLDWIVMKCLEKDRSRRYDTANTLAQDVQRHLNDEPVEARPPTKRYRLRKFAKRNRQLFALLLAAALVVLLGLAGLAVSNILIRKEQTHTQKEKDFADQAKQLAEDRADQIHRGLERLKAANGKAEYARWYVQLGNRDDAHAAFTQAVELYPDHIATWVERGELYGLVGLWDLASADFTRAFELRQPDTALRWYRHALLRIFLGDLDGYRQVCHKMKARFRGTFGMQFAWDILRTCSLSDDPNSDSEVLVRLAQNAADSRPGNWYGLYLLGLAEHRAGQHAQAAERLRQAIAATSDPNEKVLAYPVLAMALHHAGHPIEARQALQATAEAIDLRTEQMYRGSARGGFVGLGPAGEFAWWDWIECQVYYRQAKLLLDGAAPSEDWRLLVLRARALAGLAQRDAAGDQFAALLKLRPDDVERQMEYHQNAAAGAADRSQWREAAYGFTRASELAPDDANLLVSRTIALLLAGDLDGYRTACQALIEQFGDTEQPQLAGDVAFCCALTDDSIPDMQRLIPLAQRASGLFHRSYILGAALYRAGRYEESIECFEKSALAYQPTSWDWTFWAMAHQRLGHTREAKRLLAEAAGWIEAASRATNVDFSDTQPAWRGWYESGLFPLLLREAEALLGENPPAR